VKSHPQRLRRLVLSLENQLITIHLNGEAREVPEGLTLVALLQWLKLPLDGVAVERNLEIVHRSHWPETLVEAEDRLEVVHLVGGGSEN
jgi:thiamine biosynthesis protein ThiS